MYLFHELLPLFGQGVGLILVGRFVGMGLGDVTSFECRIYVVMAECMVMFYPQYLL